MKDIRQSEYSRLKNEKDAEDQTDFESVMEIGRENDYNASFLQSIRIFMKTTKFDCRSKEITAFSKF